MARSDRRLRSWLRSTPRGSGLRSSSPRISSCTRGGPQLGPRVGGAAQPRRLRRRDPLGHRGHRHGLRRRRRGVLPHRVAGFADALDRRRVGAMAITPKDIIFGVVDRGRKVVSDATGRFRRDDDEPDTPPESPAPTPRAGGTKTGASTPGTTRTQRTRAAGTSTRKPTPKTTGGAPKAGAKGAPKSATAKASTASKTKPRAGAAAKPKAGAASAAKTAASKPTTAKPRAASSSRPKTG